MSPEMKQYLETVVTSIVNEDTGEAKKSFHEYLRLKTQTILGEKEDEKDDKKLPPFMKKKKEDKDDESSGSGDEGSGESSGSGEDESSGEDKDTEKKGNPFAKKKD